MLETRRNILKIMGLSLILPFNYNAIAQVGGNSGYSKLVNKARQSGWLSLPFPELMKKIALEFLDVPYVGGTLDKSEQESCTVLLDQLDCVTYFETVLAISKCLSMNKYDFEDVFAFVQKTRYRGGIITDYTSRLHYTADWIYENVKNKVVKDITKELGGEKINFNVGFMSTNPEKYKQLNANPDYIPVINLQEKEINKRDYFYIPKDKLGTKIKGIRTCDIIAITTSINGLDYSHTGFAYVEENGDTRFLHASSAKKKVVLDTYLSDYLNGKKKDTGITVLRPL